MQQHCVKCFLVSGICYTPEKYDLIAQFRITKWLHIEKQACETSHFAFSQHVHAYTHTHRYMCSCHVSISESTSNRMWNNP